MVETQSLPTQARPDERPGARPTGQTRPERVVRFSPPGHFGPSELVDPGTFEVGSDGFAITYPVLPREDLPGLECRYRSHGVPRVRPYTGGTTYVPAERGR